MTSPVLSSSIGKAVGVLALVFFSGFATGLLSSNLIQSYTAVPSTELRLESSLQDLTEHLDLNPSQMEQIREILDDVIIEEADLLSQLKWNQLEARQRITQYLTPEQNHRFNEMVKVVFDTP